MLKGLRMVLLLVLMISPVFALGQSIVSPAYAAAYSDANIQIDVNTVMGQNKLSLGFMLDWERWTGFSQDPVLQSLAVDANFRLVRLFDFRDTSPLLAPCTHWNEATYSGTWDWTNVDDLVSKIFAAGAEPLFCLGWARNGIQNYIPNEMAVNQATGLPYPKSFAAYAAEWVRHFSSEGMPVRFYEIMNEPYFYFGWNPSDTTKLGYYVDLWNVAARSMRQQNPNVMLSQDSITQRRVLDYWLAHGDDVDYLDFHNYDADTASQYSDSQMFSRAERDGSSSVYGIAEARQIWLDSRGKYLPVIDSESNFSSAWQTGTDPRIQQMTGAVWLALMLRNEALKGLDYNVYFEFTSSKSWQGAHGTGWGFGMVNEDDAQPWYPYYVNRLIGSSLFVGDEFLNSTSSSQDVRVLAWTHDAILNILLIAKVNEPKSVTLTGIQGQLNAFWIDNTIAADVAKIQTGTFEAGEAITTNGYTVMLLQTKTQQVPLFTFKDGFESGDSSAWDGVVTTPARVETARIVDVVSSEGTYSAELSAMGSASSESPYFFKNVPSSVRLSASGDFLVNSSGLDANDSRLYFITIVSATEPLAKAGLKNVDGAILWVLVIRDGTSYTGAASGSVPVTNTWYNVGISWFGSQSQGSAELYVDDVLVCAIEGMNTSVFGDAVGVRFGLPEVYNSSGTLVYADDAFISTEAFGQLPRWDINRDGMVDMRDVDIAVLAFASTPGSGNWNPLADVDQNGIVDLRDLSFIVLDYAHQYR
jgi:hypothetical protein